MNDDWEVMVLGDLVSIKAGKYISKAEYFETGEFFIYGSNSVMGKYDKALVETPHVVMAAVGAYAGAVRFSANPSWVNNNAFALMPSERIDPFFLYLWLAGVLELPQVLAGTGQPYVKRPSLLRQRVTLPPLPVQRRIVDLMAHLDNQIANLRTERDAAEETARLFVENRLEGARGGAMWPTAEIASVCTVVTDGSHSSPKTVDDGYPYVTVRDVRDSRIHFDTAARVSSQDFLLLKKNGCAPQRGDVLFAKDGATMGKVALVPDDREFVVLSSLAILRPDTTQVLPEYLFFALGSTSFFQSALASRTGLAITRIVLKTLKSLSIPLPDIDNQLRIVGEVSALYETIGSLQKEMDALTRLRRTLLSCLLLGDREIDEAYDQLLTEAA